MRSITCWTLSRYAHWVVANGQDPHSPGQLQFDLVIEVRFRALLFNLLSWPAPSLLGGSLPCRITACIAAASLACDAGVFVSYSRDPPSPPAACGQGG